jgi:hypothetical protein
MSVNYSQCLQPIFVPFTSCETPSWKTAHEEAVWESDTARLLALIHATEDALFLRWQELGDGSAHDQERAAMEAAANDLLKLKIRKLGWPEVRS